MDFIVQKVFAQAPGGNDVVPGAAVNSLFQKIFTNIIDPAIYLIAALAVVYFLWGMFTFIQNADNPEKRKDGYMHMLWGIIGLFIMVSAKGIINIILKTMGL